MVERAAPQGLEAAAHVTQGGGHTAFDAHFLGCDLGGGKHKRLVASGELWQQALGMANKHKEVVASGLERRPQVGDGFEEELGSVWAGAAVARRGGGEKPWIINVDWEHFLDSASRDELGSVVDDGVVMQPQISSAKPENATAFAGGHARGHAHHLGEMWALDVGQPSLVHHTLGYYLNATGVE